MVPKINGKSFHHSSFFFIINNQRNGKSVMAKYIQKVNNFTVVTK